MTPSFNQGRFIRDTIESVLGQDYPAVEYLVMDGGSSDETVSILGEYVSRIAWVSGPDGGQTDAIQNGFDRAKGEVVAWLNADDVYVAGAITRAVEIMTENPAIPLVYGRATITDAAGVEIEPHAFHEWDYGYLRDVENFIPQPATFFRRDALVAVGGLSRDLHYVMDYDLWLKLGAYGGAIGIDQEFARIRTYAETKTVSGGLKRVEEMRMMLARHGRSRLPSGHYADYVRACFNASAAAWHERNYGAAARYAVRGAPNLLRPRTFAQATRFAWRSIARRGREPRAAS